MQSHAVVSDQQDGGKHMIKLLFDGLISLILLVGVIIVVGFILLLIIALYRTLTEKDK